MSFLKKCFSNNPASSHQTLAQLRRTEFTSTERGEQVWFSRPTKVHPSDTTGWGLLIGSRRYSITRGTAGAEPEVSRTAANAPQVASDSVASPLSLDGIARTASETMSLIGWTKRTEGEVETAARNSWIQVVQRGPRAEQDATQAFLEDLAQAVVGSTSSTSFDFAWFELNVTTPLVQVAGDSFPLPNQVAASLAAKEYNV